MSQCDIELKSKLKKFYKDEESLEFALNDFKGQVENVFDQAAKEGVSPIKLLEQRSKENLREIQFDAFRRMMQVESYKKASNFVAQFDDAADGVKGLFFTRHGEKYEGIGSLEQVNASEKNRRIGILKRELGVEDGQRIMKRWKEGDPDLELQVRKIERGEYDQTQMGSLDSDAIKLHKAIKKLGMYDYKQKRLSGADVGFKGKRLHRQAHSARNMEELGQTGWVNKALKYMDDTPIIQRIQKSAELVEQGGKIDAETRAIAKLADSPEPVKAYLEMHYEKIMTKERAKALSIDDSFVSLEFDTRKKALETNTFFEFKNAEAEMAYNREVNGVSLFESVQQDIIRDSGTIASMKLLGPNPNLTIEKLLREYPIKNADEIKRQFRYASGRKAGVSTGMLARSAEKARKLTDMALLSTSLASTLPDFAIAAYVVSSKTGKNYFSTLAGLAKENMKLIKSSQRGEYMRRLNILMDDELYDFHRIGEDGMFNTALDPFKGDVLSESPARRMIEGVGRKVGGAIDKTHNRVMRLTGLPAQSQIMRTASVKNYAMYLADIKDQDFGSLYKGTKNLFERIGIDEKEWDLIRNKAVVEGPDGSVFLDPESILNLTNDDLGFRNVADFERYQYALHDKVSGMYDFIANTSSPTPGVRSKAWVETIDPNTVAGVLVRTVAQYKSFSISVYNSLREGGVLEKDRMAQTAYLMATGMGLAYVGLMAKEGLKGKAVELPDKSSPQDIAAFSAALLARSGTAGLMFDFLSTDYNSPWRSLAGDVLGPSPRIMESGISIGKYPLDMLMSRNEKDRKKANRYLLNNLERGMPALPFTRTLLNEKIFDILHKSLNTGAKR